MYYNHFAVQIDLFKYKRFKDGGCAYKNTGSSKHKRKKGSEEARADKGWAVKRALPSKKV